MPSVRASSSPTDSTSRCLPCSSKTTVLTPAYGAIVATCCQDAADSEPSSQL